MMHGQRNIKPRGLSYCNYDDNDGDDDYYSRWLLC